jgi:magnesium-transporting ATPase (P-type)
MDEHFAPRPLANWYLPAAIASLLFMALGCAAYLMHVLSDPAALPLDQRAAYDAEPAWLTGAFAISVWVGALGAVMLVVRRKFAEPLLLISLIAVLAWLAGMMLTPALREAMAADEFVLPIVVTIVTWTIFWFARHSRQREWLR